MTTKKGNNREIAVTLVRREGKSDDYVLAESELRPEIRNACNIAEFVAPRLPGEAGPWQGVDVMRDMVAATRDGDMSLPSDFLTAQIVTLDSVFTDCLRRSALNLNQFPEAAERYMRMALKAQANLRASIAELAKLHQPREQTVRHVHVHEGGQAVVAETVTVTGGQNGKGTSLPHAAIPLATLHGANAGGNGVPITSDQGEAALQNARGPQPRRRKGQQARA